MQAQQNALKQKIRDMMAIRKEFIGAPKLELTNQSSGSARSKARRSEKTADVTQSHSTHSFY